MDKKLEPEFYKLEIDGTSGREDLEIEIAQHLQAVFNIFKQKQASYGPGNIAKFGEKGVIIRMNDKMERLIRLVYDEGPNPLADETVEDTYLDMADYAVIALVCRSGEWPGQK